MAERSQLWYSVLLVAVLLFSKDPRAGIGHMKQVLRCNQKSGGLSKKFVFSYHGLVWDPSLSGHNVAMAE
jgi:hypothetical protein